VIENEEKYEQFLAVAERLTFNQHQTPEESALYDLVTILIESYEAQHYAIDESSPVELLLHIIESSGIDAVELASIFGSTETLEEVLAGLQSITAAQAQALGDKFKLSPKAFLS
jgi:HTH-type transcriptional regulator / antitoxin HigA